MATGSHPHTPTDRDRAARAHLRYLNQTFRIAIGACLRLAAGGHALEEIAAHDPDVMLWLGDNIYADTEDMSEMRALYEKLAENPRFQALAASTE